MNVSINSNSARTTPFMEHGFIKDENNKAKEQKQAYETSLKLPIIANKLCKYCDNPRIDFEVQQAFGISVCNECKYTKLRLINKTAIIKEYLLGNEDLKDVKCLTRPNPKKGTWSDMQLFQLEEIETIAKRKWGSIENIENEKERRKELLLDKKKKKIRKRVKELRKCTLIEDRMKINTHKHTFILVDGVCKCECGMVVDQEEI
ncbi:DNA excision repair protein XPA/XPAC/RAD14 [Trachipleistophora hominis]|uniref:DNA excision repair protein XPA/XPAC/RAD14 n=1 Tax=Trachipleistophora hominis TaxID=72359 RepID=L7JVN1_TRAHO|nr:DNA excision repair protein XPA/XPAC/RAD14 [Trachipleistophora hominis]